jgi:hypothetical protein
MKKGEPSGSKLDHRVKDNGAKWSSYVKQSSDGSFPFDERMKKERPKDWEAMIAERMAWVKKDKDDIKAFRKTSSSRNFRMIEK